VVSGTPSGASRTATPAGLRLFSVRMRRPLVLTLLLCLLAAAPAAAADKPALSAQVSSCTTGVDASERAAAFTGSMPAQHGSREMQMRFVLLQRRGSTGTFRAVVVPDWGGWETSDRGRAGFVFTQRIESLLAPAAYKAAIYFRWVDRRGRVQRMVRRTTRACEQPDVRPELTFGALAATPVSGAGAAYTVDVRNDGRSTAGPFAVTLSFDGADRGSATMGPLDAGAQGEVTIGAPRCTPGSVVTVTVDPAQAVDESDETDNVVQRPCPLGAAG
jgi:hypothetical protein